MIQKGWGKILVTIGGGGSIRGCQTGLIKVGQIQKKEVCEELAGSN